MWTQHPHYSMIVALISYFGKSGLNGGKQEQDLILPKKNNAHESILFAFPGGSDNAIVIKEGNMFFN